MPTLTDRRFALMEAQDKLWRFQVWAALTHTRHQHSEAYEVCPELYCRMARDIEQDLERERIRTGEL